MSQDVVLEVNPTMPAARAAGLAFSAVLLGHVTVDVLSAVVPTTLGILEERLQLTPQQSAWLFGIGPLFSGLAQPICALVSDRMGTRKLGTVGLALGALGIGAMGLVNEYWSLALVYTAGVVGIGMFHPVGAATIGQLWPDKRTSAISWFFVAGMVGGVLGSLLWPRLLAFPERFTWLPWIVAPIAALVVVLHRSFAGLLPLRPRRDLSADEQSAPIAWLQVGMLYVAASLRFCVNTALAYLFLRWMQNEVATLHGDWSSVRVARESAPLVGNLNAALLVGMATGGMSAGAMVRNGKEKWPLVLVPLCFAPVIGLFPFLPVVAGYLLAVAAGIGFASMIPVSISLAQHLMPGRTNLASSLMMGGAWAVAMLGPTCAEWGVSNLGLEHTFIATAITLAVAGLVCLPLRQD